MIILKEQKLIFFRVPKTGSTAIQYNLKHSTSLDFDNCIIPPSKEISDIHMMPQEAYDEGILTDEMIETYKMYAVIRNPHDRMMSACSHVASPFVADPGTVQMRIDILGSKFLPKIFKKPQINWFTINDKIVVTPILYDNYKESLSEIYESAGISVQNELRNTSKTRATLDEVFDTEELQEFLASYNEQYEQDWELYNSLL